MKKGLLIILSLLFSFAGYANQCSEYWHKENYKKPLLPIRKKLSKLMLKPNFSLYVW